MLNGINYLKLTRSKELFEIPVIELKTTPFYVKCLNHKKRKRK